MFQRFTNSYFTCPSVSLAIATKRKIGDLTRRSDLNRGDLRGNRVLKLIHYHRRAAIFSAEPVSSINRDENGSSFTRGRRSTEVDPSDRADRARYR